jgi:hypothetical protein
MIIEISKPLTSFFKTCNYHQEKVDKNVAKLIYNHTGIFNPKLFAEYFERHCEINTRLIKNKGFDISINLPHNENLLDSQFINLAQDYIKQMGYENCPYIITRHYDKMHEHIHLTISSIDLDGKRINDGKMHERSQRISRELEKKYNIQQTVYTRKSNSFTLYKV